MYIYVYIYIYIYIYKYIYIYVCVCVYTYIYIYIYICIVPVRMRTQPEPDSLDARLFPYVVCAVAHLENWWVGCVHIHTGTIHVGRAENKYRTNLWHPSPPVSSPGGCVHMHTV